MISEMFATNLYHGVQMNDRTWSISLRFPDGSELPLDPPSRDLNNYEGDLLASCVPAAIRQIKDLVEGEDLYGYSVMVYKTTKARGTEFDRSFYLDRDRNGRIVGRR
jgi:hypothetical protein